MFDLIIFATMLALGYFVGSAREKKHFAQIVVRERKLLSLATQSGKRINPEYQQCLMVAGSVVIASDYFKNFAGSLKSFFGGNMSTHETLMDRARREAILRAKEKAAAWGADEIVGFRVEFATLDKMGVEVLAYGTAVKRKPFEIHSQARS